MTGHAVGATIGTVGHCASGLGDLSDGPAPAKQSCAGPPARRDLRDSDVAIPIAQFGSLSIMEAIVHEVDGFRPGREPSAVGRVDMVPSDTRVTKPHRRLPGLDNAEHGSATELAVSGGCWVHCRLGLPSRGAGGMPIDLVRAKPSTLSDPGYLLAWTQPTDERNRH